MPAKKRSFPTSARSAKLASSEALGEPIPIGLARSLDNERLKLPRRLFARQSSLRRNSGCANPPFAVHEFVAKAAAVAEEVAVHLAVETVQNRRSSP